MSPFEHHSNVLPWSDIGAEVHVCHLMISLHTKSGVDFNMHYVYIHTYASNPSSAREGIVLHPAGEGQKPETAVQGLHLRSFGAACV